MSVILASGCHSSPALPRASAPNDDSLCGRPGDTSLEEGVFQLETQSLPKFKCNAHAHSKTLHVPGEPSTSAGWKITTSVSHQLPHLDRIKLHPADPYVRSLFIGPCAVPQAPIAPLVMKAAGMDTRRRWNWRAGPPRSLRSDTLGYAVASEPS